MHRHITYAGFAKGANYFWGGACDAWHSHAFARGVRGHASPKFFLMVQFVAFWSIFSEIFYFQKV